MDVKKEKTILSKYEGKNDICDIFMKQKGLTKPRMNVLWDNYMEFMLVKVFRCDVGSHNDRKFSTYFSQSRSYQRTRYNLNWTTTLEPHPMKVN